MADWPLPRWAHLPGRTAGADHDPLDAAKRSVPARFAGPPAAGHPAIRYGIALQDAGFHWEAHEVLEAAWLASAPNGRDREALRAIIQLANAALKLRMGRPRAALRLLAEVRERLGNVAASSGTRPRRHAGEPAPRSPAGSSRGPHPEVLAAGEPRRTHHGCARFEDRRRRPPRHQEGVDARPRPEPRRGGADRSGTASFADALDAPGLSEGVRASMAAIEAGGPTLAVPNVGRHLGMKENAASP